MKKHEILNIFLIKYLKEMLVIFFVIFVSLKGLYWLACGITLFYFFYKILKLACNPIRSGKVKRAIQRIIKVVFVLLLSITSEIFLVEIYKIPSNSMENSLLPGDVILVNKLAYGPRIPNSIFEISWMSILFNKNNDLGAKDSYRRAKGLSYIKRGDILVYNLNKTYVVVKRCVAIPGDLFEIREGEIYTNGIEFDSPPSIVNTYVLGFPNRSSLAPYVDKLESENILLNYNSDSNRLTARLAKDEVEILKKDKSISVKMFIDSAHYNQEQLFAAPEKTSWTLDNMGPFRIPRKGMSICLTPVNLEIYGKTIRDFENVNIEKRGDNYFINDQLVTKYLFKQNYYFMMGDNRMESMDSRYTGFIPERNIIGKATMILWSFGKDGFLRLDRLLRSLLLLVKNFSGSYV